MEAPNGYQMMLEKRGMVVCGSFGQSGMGALRLGVPSNVSTDPDPIPLNS